MRTILLAATLASTLPVPALARLEPSPASVLANKIPGSPQDCLPTFQRDRESRTFASGDILYRGSGTTWYLNHPKDCPPFVSQMALVTSVPTSQLCRGDIVRIIDPVSGFFYGACSLGSFTPYSDPK